MYKARLGIYLVVVRLSREVVDRLVISKEGLRIGDGSERYLIIPARIFGIMYEVTYRLVGHGVAGILYMIGKEVGKGLIEEISHRLESKGIKEPAQAAKELFTFLSDIGFGNVVLTSIDESKAVIRMFNSPTSSSISNCSRPSCHLERGILAGAAEAFLRKKCRAVEVKCRCLGNPYCEFVVSWES